MSEAGTALRYLMTLHALTIGVSAFLLFAIQPIVVEAILPCFG